MVRASHSCSNRIQISPQKDVSVAQAIFKFIHLKFLFVHSIHLYWVPGIVDTEVHRVLPWGRWHVSGKETDKSCKQVRISHNSKCHQTRQQKGEGMGDREEGGWGTGVKHSPRRPFQGNIWAETIEKSGEEHPRQRELHLLPRTENQTDFYFLSS